MAVRELYGFTKQVMVTICLHALHDIHKVLCHIFCASVDSVDSSKNVYLTGGIIACFSGSVIEVG